MTDKMMQANQVPLVEQLRSVPANAHLAINTPNPLGYDTQHFAIGEMCHRAAALLDAMRAELEAAKRDAARWQDRAEKAERAYSDMAKRGTWREAANYSEYWRVRAEQAERALDAAPARKERT